MIDELIEWTRTHRDQIHAFQRRCHEQERVLMLRTDLCGLFAALQDEGAVGGEESALHRIVPLLQEAVLQAPWAYYSLRLGPGRWRHFRMHLDECVPEPVGVAEFLRFKETLVRPDAGVEQVLEIDFAPFNREFPRLKEARSIGQGVLFLNRQLASALFQRSAEGLVHLLRFLRLHAMNGRQLMLHGHVADVPTLQDALRRAQAMLEMVEPELPCEHFEQRLLGLGFAPGWGNTAARVAETMSLLTDILEAPSPTALEAFLARIPMVSRILIVSPHGYFAQDNVLGRPDTGGQVVYILDQVRALEREMRERLLTQGVDVEPQVLVLTRLIPEAEGTSCNQPLEPIHGCRSAAILRVPFRHPQGDVVREWISRFEIWPYLEAFAHDGEREALAQLGGKPDLVIGNYSDGNLVASLISQHLGVTQCNIAHALEQNKYLHSALYWRENEETYHFSRQYTADLIAMNSADFIVTSTYQEIAGTHTGTGQYEVYQAFTLPGLYRVLHGVDVFSPQFNIVSPGADENIYFPFTAADRRLHSLQPSIDRLLYGADPGVPWRGGFADRQKPLLFTLARLDRIKNLASLVEWYAGSHRLRARANLLLVAGHVDPACSVDAEEREQICRLHALMDEHRLDGELRWLGTRLDKALAGELYRHVADLGGVFVQPALFEAFGLTVIEAMASGLPVFATCHGGPMEIIQHGISGYHIDPNDGAAAAEAIADFLEQAAADPQHWQRVSTGAMQRVETRYTWRRYAERMMTLTRIYGFWKYVSNLEREETSRYLQMFYHLLMRPMSRRI